MSRRRDRSRVPVSRRPDGSLGVAMSRCRDQSRVPVPWRPKRWHLGVAMTQCRDRGRLLVSRRPKEPGELVSPRPGIATGVASRCHGVPITRAHKDTLRRTAQPQRTLGGRRTRAQKPHPPMVANAHRPQQHKNATKKQHHPPLLSHQPTQKRRQRRRATTLPHNSARFGRISQGGLK
jgi:hypothetical protein